MRAEALKDRFVEERRELCFVEIGRKHSLEPGEEPVQIKGLQRNRLRDVGAIPCFLVAVGNKLAKGAKRAAWDALSFLPVAGSIGAVPAGFFAHRTC